MVQDPAHLALALQQVRLLLDGALSGLAQLSFGPKGASPTGGSAGASAAATASSWLVSDADLASKNAGLGQAVRALDFLHGAHKNLVRWVGLVLSCSVLAGSHPVLAVFVFVGQRPRRDPADCCHDRIRAGSPRARRSRAGAGR